MKPIILNNITAMSSADVEKSLPVAISLVEYSSNLGNEKSTLECLRNDDDHNNDNHNKGTLGNMFLSYSIDCKHGRINPEARANELKFKYIEDKITSMKCPTFSRRFLTDNFFIYKIPDYSRQAMTPGFSDMVVVIYTTRGYKIPQRYIGMIKSYTQDICYVLVDKSIRNLENFRFFEDAEDEASDEAKTFEIRIKQNAETDPEVDKQKLTLINDPQDYSIMYVYPMHFENDSGISYVYDENDVFLDGEAVGEDVNDGTTKPQKTLRNTIVNAQAQYGDEYHDDYDTYMPNVKDYFKQVLLIDYDKKGTYEPTVQRPNEVAYDYNSVDYYSNLMRVYSAQRIPEFFDTNEAEPSDSGMVFKIKAPVQNEYEENFEVFDSMAGRLLIPHVDFEYEYTDNKKGTCVYISGIKINSGHNVSAIEILPYYDSHRRIRLYGHFSGSAVPTTKTAIRAALIKFLNNSSIDANIDEYTLRMYDVEGKLINALTAHDAAGAGTATIKETYPAYFILSDFDHNVAFPTSANKLGDNGGFVLDYGAPINSSSIKPNLRGTVKEYNCFSLYPGNVTDKELCNYMEIYSNDVGNNVYITPDEINYTYTDRDDGDAIKTIKADVYNLKTDKLNSDNTAIKYTADKYVDDITSLKHNIEYKRKELHDKIKYICDSLCERLSKVMENSPAFIAQTEVEDIQYIDYNGNQSDSDYTGYAFICIKLNGKYALEDPGNAIRWERSTSDNNVRTDYVSITPYNGYYIFPILKEYKAITLKHKVRGQLYYFDGRGTILNG